MNSPLSGASDPNLTGIRQEYSSSIPSGEVSGTVPAEQIMGEENYDVTQQFFEFVQLGIKVTHDAPPQFPSLAVPLESDTGPQSFEDPTWLKATKEVFKRQLKEQMLKKTAKKEGVSSAQDRKDAEVKTVNKKDEKAQSSKDEAPTLPLPQIEKQLNHILHAINTNTVEELTEEDREMVTQATTETQEIFGLPPSWTVKSQSIKDCTPIREVSPPSILVEMRVEALRNNFIELIESIERASSTLKNDPKLVPPDALEHLAQIIFLTKSQIRKTMVDDAAMASSRSKEKYGTAESRQKSNEDFFKKLGEFLKKVAQSEESSGVFGAIFKGLGIVGILVGLATILTAPFSGGITLGAFIGAVVTVTLGSLSLAETEIGLIKMGMDEINKYLEKTYPPDRPGSEASKNGAKIGILAALSVAFAFLVVISPGSAGTIGNQLASHTAKEVAKEVFKQVSKEVGKYVVLTAIMSSNYIPEIIMKGVESTGALKDEKMKMITQVVIASLMTAVTMYLAYKSRPPSPADIKPVQVDISLWEKMKEVFIASIPKDIQGIADTSKFLVETTKSGTQMVEGGTKGMQKLDLAKLHEELGLIEEQKKKWEILYDIHSEACKSFQDVIAAHADLLEMFQSTLNAIYESKKILKFSSGRMQG